MCNYRITVYKHLLKNPPSSIDFETRKTIEQKKYDQRSLEQLTEQALERWAPVFQRDNLHPETKEGQLLLEAINASYADIREELLSLLDILDDCEKIAAFEAALKALANDFDRLDEIKTEYNLRYEELGIELSDHVERRTLALLNTLTPILKTLQPEDEEAFCELFFTSYIPPSIEDHEGNTLLHIALKASNSAIIKQLLLMGANPFQKPSTEDGISPLMYAVQLATETNDAALLVHILDYLNDHPTAYMGDCLPAEGQAPFYKSQPFYDFPTIELDVARGVGVSDETHKERLEQIQKNITGWFVFSEMKKFLDDRTRYYKNNFQWLRFVTAPLQRLTQLAALYQHLYDCFTNCPEGILDLNQQFNAFRQYLIVMKQGELGDDKPETGSFFDRCLHAANKIKGSMRPNQSEEMESHSDEESRTPRGETTHHLEIMSRQYRNFRF
jgi:hypothetical protein